MPRARLHALLTGRVQGVGFRYFAVRLADDLGLTGWVRNTYGGEVEVVAEGERADLEAFLAHLRRGPRLAYVEHIEVEWAEPRNEFRDFRVTG